MGLYNDIKEMCKQKGVTINKLEKDLGFARSSIIKFDTNSPSIEKISKIADYLKVSIDSLLQRDKERKNLEFDIFEEALALLNWEYVEIIHCSTPGLNIWLNDNEKEECSIGKDTRTDCEHCEFNIPDYYFTDGKFYYKFTESEFNELAYCLKPYLSFRLVTSMNKKTPITKKEFQEINIY
jgi:transcriptional regulator with XRE-family HTH domain